MALAFVPGATQGSVVTDSTINSYRCQWIFQQVGVDSEERPVYSIINKLSGNVLNWNGSNIEALDDNSGEPHRRWRLVPCDRRYFAIVNVATGQYLSDDGKGPASNNERKNCWTLVSRRELGKVIIAIDPDVSQPHRESHHLYYRRAAGGNKGKGKDKCNPDHIPRDARIRKVSEPAIVDIFGRLIAQWVENQLPMNIKPRQFASAEQAEVAKWEITVSAEIRKAWLRWGEAWYDSCQS